MRARVFDRNTGEYYISEVYGIINCGVNIYIVDEYHSSDKVTLVEYLDFSSDITVKVNVEKIDSNPPDSFKWIIRVSDGIEFLNDAIGEKRKYHYFSGYEFIWERKNALTELLKNGAIEKTKIGIGNLSTKPIGWSLIESQEDIDFLMNRFAGFQDSVISEFSYITDDRVSQDNLMILSEACSKKLRIVFESVQAEKIEVVFLAPRLVQLVPPGENYLSDLYGASIFLKNCMVYFYDSELKEMPDEYDGTFAEAMGMMWRSL